MSLLKDWCKYTEEYVLTRRICRFFDLPLWLRLHKRRKQRADRGWADRDAWNAGEHIARMTADMLQYLADGKTSWPDWFKYNINNSGSKKEYTDLQPVIEDITAWLEYSETSWSDNLTTRPYRDELMSWYDGEKKLTGAQLQSRMNKWHKEEQKLYKKAQKAMVFFGRNFSSFWD